jgi:hypothetical protein
MSRFTHIIKENPGAMVVAAGGIDWHKESYSDVIYTHFALVAQA